MIQCHKNLAMVLSLPTKDLPLDLTAPSERVLSYPLCNHPQGLGDICHSFVKHVEIYLERVTVVCHRVGSLPDDAFRDELRKALGEHHSHVAIGQTGQTNNLQSSNPLVSCKVFLSVAMNPFRHHNKREFAGGKHLGTALTAQSVGWKIFLFRNRPI